MFKSVKPMASTEAASSGGAESDDDTISLTSTVGHDEDEEFEVERILAEQLFEDGEMYYLVDWTGFTLGDATWEPQSNLGDELKAMWEETKAKHATGEVEPFDVQLWHDARAKVMEGKAERHRRRNAKRQRLGLPLTEPLPEVPAPDQDPSDEEAVEDDGIEDSALGPTAKPRPKTQQRIFRGIPSAAPTNATAPAEGSRARDAARSPTDEPAPRRSCSSSTSSKRNQLGHPQSTGFQGTARKPSIELDNAMQKSKPNPVNPVPPPVPTTGNRPTPASRKPLTAKKSTRQPTGNIFTGGKMRKPRLSLKDIMSDSTKEPKLFDRHRYRRLLEKRSREKEDIAPDVSSLRLFDITKVPGASRRSAGGSIGSIRSPASLVQSPTALSPQESLTPTEGLSTAAGSSTFPTTVEPDGGPAKKKRKSVRFLDDDSHKVVISQEPEPIAVDSPVREDAAQVSPSGTGPTTAMKRPSLDQSHLRPPAPGSQSSRKKLVFARSSVEVIFNGLPLESPTNHTWLADFLAKESLEFEHSCFAKTAALQIGTLVKEPLASGAIVSKEGGQDAEQVAEYLAAGLLGLYHGQGECNVLIFPARCEDWRFILRCQDPTSPSAEPALRYFMFSSQQDCRQMLPSLPPAPESLPAVEHSGREVGRPDRLSDRELMVKRLFGFHYSHLLPVKPKVPDVHIFFLAIPPSRAATMQALYHWLRACNRDCRIFTSNHAGSWAAFQSAPDNGVVIIHETLAWSLRRFPHLSRRLIPRTRYDQYWCLSEPVHGLPLYPSISISEVPVSPGDIRFTRLFPYRTAILLTPSFLVSEPRRSAEFLQWFISTWGAKFHYRLVTAHNIHEYLLELAEEKYKARQDLLRRPGELQPDIAANLSRLSSEDCKFRYVAAGLAADLHLIRTAKAGPSANDEENSPLVYVDSSIDPNDEQSLVNWFGWWTTLRADQFRKFHVVGSSETIKYPGSRRGERMVRIPRYTAVTINDPDAVMEVVQEEFRHVDAEAGGELGNGIEAKDSGREELENAQAASPFQSDLIRSEDSASIAAYLEELTTVSNSFQCILYKFPVSWLDLDMADHFDDFTMKWSRIPDWFKFPWPFGSRNNKFNTYIGFFYTIAEAWDPDNPPKSRHPERHPWIAVYRPVNPHIRPWTRCEIIIWDPAARTKFSKARALAEKDLHFMQRQLIQHVRELGPEKNPGTWLDQVWLGGFDWPPNCESRSPLDVTLLFLREMLGNIKEYLPAPEHTMEGRGYRRVKLDPLEDQGSRSAANDSDSVFVNQESRDGSAPMELDSPAGGNGREEDVFDDDYEGARIIFHPPRGDKATVGQFRSRCRNRLYEEARLARARAGPGEPAPTHMLYSFPPTMDWYKEQEAEGRGFAHINVESWEGIFDLLEVGKSSGKEGRDKNKRSERAEKAEKAERSSASVTASVSDGMRDSTGPG